MIDLVLREFRRILKEPLPWLLLLLVNLAMVVSFATLDSPEVRAYRAANDPVVRTKGELAQDPALLDFKEALADLSTSDAMKMRYRNEISLIEEDYGQRLITQIRNRYYLDLAQLGAAPKDQAAFMELVSLLAEAGEKNAQARNAPFFEYASDYTGFTFRLFSLAQNGSLILAALALGLLSDRLPKGALLRRAGTSRLFGARVLALTLTGFAVLVLPRLLGSLLVLAARGPGYPGLLLPFNPRDGYPLYQINEGIGRLLPFRAVAADSLVSLGRAFFYMYVYELLQIFLWVSIGLLAGVLTRRRHLAFAVPVGLLAAGRLLYPLVHSLTPARFLFPFYHDAVRDVIGGAGMATGLAYREVAAQDYGLAVSVMFLTGIFAVYLADLKEKRRLFQLDQGGDDVEDL